ncbi:hypothetical protein F4802DRAFT_583985 [Xylaria palmicola]|nr:hypothetical protein F4802DRAFT_583985 [Xylaria palmicola]
MATKLPVHFKSQRACVTCRKWKKQCDKMIPRCSRCIRKSICCDYTITPADNFVSQHQIPGLHVAASTDMVLVETSPCLPRITQLGWGLLLEALCNPLDSHQKGTAFAALIQRILVKSGTSLVIAASKFMDTIYPWFPIIDAETITRLIKSSEDESTDSLSAFRVLCMHLLTQVPCHHPNHMTSNSLYLAARRFFFLFQDVTSHVPVELLQGGLLITLYECSHGIWDAAYLSLTNCIALSQIAGVKFEEIFNSHDNDPRKASCWAIILLDRLISLLNVENPRPPLISHTDSQHDLTWLSRAVTAVENHDGSYDRTRLCVAAQTAYTLGDTLCYISHSKGVFTKTLVYDLVDKFNADLINKLLSTSQSRPLHFCDTTAFAVSVLVELRLTRRVWRTQQIPVSPEEVVSLHSALNMAHEMVHSATEMTASRQMGAVSFIGLVSVLRTIIHLAAVRGSGFNSGEWSEMESLLLRFSKRWIIGVQLLRDFNQHKQAARAGLSNDFAKV